MVVFLVPLHDIFGVEEPVMPPVIPKEEREDEEEEKQEEKERVDAKQVSEVESPLRQTGKREAQEIGDPEACNSKKEKLLFLHSLSASSLAL